MKKTIINLFFVLTDIVGTFLIVGHYLTGGVRFNTSEDIRDSGLFSDVEQGE